MKLDFFGSGSGGQRPEVEAARLLRDGQFMAAGKLFEEAGRLSQALEAYLGGQEWSAAAAIFDRQGKREQAAEHFLRAGDYKRAADALARAGQTGRAAEILLAKGQSQEAAKVYAAGGAWDKAAELYAKAGYPLRAAQAFEKHGDLARAAESYERHFVENVAYGSAHAASADQKTALLAGQLYEQVGDLAKALEIYARGHYEREAAAAATALGDFARAAEHYAHAEDLEAAAASWERAGDPVRAALLRGEVAFKQDRLAEAAALFLEGRDFYRAAELFESQGLLAEAGRAYEAGGSFAEAGSVLLRAGDKPAAAAAYEKAGQYETAARLQEEQGDGLRAAELFERAGLTYKSGVVAVRAGQRERAIALLQRVEPGDENFVPALELLAQVFVEMNLPALALERLQGALAGQPLSMGNLGLAYWAAVCLDASGDRAAAEALFNRVLALDFGFRDTAQRLQRMKTAAPAAEEYELVEDDAPAPAPAPAPAQAGTPPSVLTAGPRFSTQEEVGRGPLGVVYRAEEADGRSVALRVLPESALKPEIIGPLVGDLVAAARLSHPNLVKVLGVVDFEGASCVLSEYVRGSNLDESLRTGQRMSVQQCHALARTLAQVLSFVHARGMLHASLRPSNVMVVSGVVKLADLGLARLYRGVAPLDAYRAPENRMDVAGDVYALGALLYHLLTGVEPKSRPGSPATRPSQLAPGVPERFDRFLLRCLDPRPDGRFPAAEEVVQALEAMITIG
ncbi:MAG: protein kinase [Vicinamibacteria bacterium]